MKFAFITPGQGSQSLGMMAAYGDAPVIRDTFAEASEALGRDLWRLVSEGPAEALSQTVNTQPLMLAADVAVWRLWRALGGPDPAYLAGHSLGEYAALVMADVLDFPTAIRLVEVRARAMQEAVPEGEGAMAAILGLDAEKIAACCRVAAQGEVVEPVNFNAPEQTVIAGHKTAVERAMEACRQAGAKRAVALPVSAPFHSSLMAPAAARLASALADVVMAPPRIPVIHNVDVAVHQEPAAIKDALVRQAAQPVRWTETMRLLADRGVTHVYECGPGKVLMGLTKRCAPTLSGIALADRASLEAALAEVRGGKNAQ
ncbi:MAG: ACP S-malonyltransferase [Rhodocyclaceae bacterium]|nr:ACP S-malonyltransferase [Rhodocyclaceae bacterium]